MQTGYKVVDAMTRMVVTASQNATIDECAQLMEKEDIGSIIIKENDELKGIITEQDIVRKVVARELKSATIKAKEIMASRVVTIEPGKDIYDALVAMRDADVRHLPVLDKGKIAGILTIKDILKVEPELFNLIAEKMQIREEEQKPIFTRQEGRCAICGEYFENINDEDGMPLCQECKDKQEEELEV